MARVGLSYPRDPGGAGGHHAIACSLSGPRPPGDVNDLFQPEREAFAIRNGARIAGREMCSGLSPQDGRLTILSSEIFSTFDAGETAALAAFAAPVDRWVAYVRNGIDFIHACWSTKVRWGYGRDFDAFLAAAVTGQQDGCIQGPINYFELLSRTFGEDRLHLRHYEAALAHPRGIAGDFLEAELGFEGLGFEAATANASPSAAFTELARAVASEAGAGPGGSRPAGHGRFAALARSSVGKQLVAALLPIVEQVMRSISIADVRAGGGVIRADGSLVVETPSLADKLAAWRFPILQTCSFARLEELQDRLDGAPAYGRLVEALRSP
ncbi:MAG TPA: hypothetical protein VIJ94_03545 [Caulobacteraceae bacterium]